MNLILQPCSNKIAFKHYNDTILNKELTLELIKDCLKDSDYKNLSNIYGIDSVHIWGVMQSSYQKWSNMSIGDIALFSRKNEIFSCGVVCYKLHNIKLANRLWGSCNDGNTWEFIYFLVEMSNINISYKNFNKAVGYKENYIIQGFNILNQEKTNRFLNQYPLDSKTFIQEVKEDEYMDIINNPLISMDSVDSKVLTLQRKEQSFLRRNLFKGKSKAKCAICGEEFPISLLCCSHIKRRCCCTLEEKKDYKNIVLPMCDFGCDKLYENGYISVENGFVKIIKLTGVLSVDKRLKSLDNRRVVGYNSKNKKYFDEHLKQNLWEKQL